MHVLFSLGLIAERDLCSLELVFVCLGGLILITSRGWEVGGEFGGLIGQDDPICEIQ